MMWGFLCIKITDFGQNLWNFRFWYENCEIVTILQTTNFDKKVLPWNRFLWFCFLTLWIFSFGGRELWQMELWKNGDSFKVAQLRLKLEKSHFLWFLPHFRHISTITRDAIQVFCQGFVELGRPLRLKAWAVAV